MKKHSLIKILAIILLLVVILSHLSGLGNTIGFFKLFEGRNGVSYIALGDVLMNYIQSFYYFFDTVLFLLVLGAFYGLLEHIDAYTKLKENLVSKIGDNKKRFLFIVIGVFAVLSSLTGLNMALLVFIPFAVSVILMLGYDKITALLSTVGATIVGLIGGIFVTFRDPSGYTASFTTFESLVGLEDKYVNIFPKIVLLIVATVLLMLYVNRYISKKDTKEETKKAKVEVVEEAKVEKKIEKKEVVKSSKKPTGKAAKKSATKGTKKTTSKNPNKAAAKKDDTIVIKKGPKTWPLIVVCAVLLVLLVLGYMPWSTQFGVTVFDDFHTWLTGLKAGEYAFFNNIISANFTAFGTWGQLGNFMMVMILLIVFSIIIKFIYKVKFDDMLDYFKEGMKKMLPAAAVAMLAYAVLVCVYNKGCMETIISNGSDKFGDNTMIASLISIFGSITNVDLYYTAAGIFTPITSSLSDNANLQVFAILFQSFYGLVQIVGPTSLLLVICLTYYEVPYTSWLKNIWRLVLGLFIAIFVIILIVSVI